MSLERFQQEEALANALGVPKESLYPWQKRLLDRFRQNDLPAAIDIPTGLGKTSVMAVWLIARACGAKLPRRLVYVVDRRAVVDQATDEAEQLRGFVEANPNIKAELGLNSRPLPVSTLRGQFVDNREWLEDPSIPAIIVGTVDMIGSRVLFEGYRVSRKMRPYHAGLIGADTLVVLDEAHLVPAFESLLAVIASRTDDFGPVGDMRRGIVPLFKLLPLSATGGNSDRNCHTLEKDDLDHPVAKKRLVAPKRLVPKPLTQGLSSESTQPSAENSRIASDPNASGDARSDATAATDKKKNDKDFLTDALVHEAWELTGNGRQPLRVLVFCDKREVAQKVVTAVGKLAGAEKKSGRDKVEIETELFVGGRRVFEREGAKERLRELGFLAGTKVNRTKPAFLIATSAAEVGVDLDADHMVCDLVAWERMVQRLGRVNRRGDGDATVIVVVPPEPLPKKKEQEAIDKQSNRAGLEEKEGKLIDDFNARLTQWQNYQAPFRHLPKRDGGFDASPGALRQLKEIAKATAEIAASIRAATTPPPLRPPLTRALVDAWSMTSLEMHTGRPAIDPWLRGWIEDDPPQTAVVWRNYLPIRRGKAPTKKEVEGFFEAAPPHSSELLETHTYRVIEWLGKRAGALVACAQKDEEGLPGKADVVAFVLERDLTLRRRVTLGELLTSGEKETEALEFALRGATLVVDVRLAGLQNGLLENGENSSALTADGAAWLAEDVVGFRVRSFAAGESFPPDPNWRERRRFAAEMSSEGEPIRWLVIQKWRDAAATEDDRSASREQLLDEHQSWAEQRARDIAKRLGLESRYVEMLAAAARLHDEGKRTSRWQRAFKAPIGAYYAKAEGPINYTLLDGYRHEFGSLPHVEHHDRIKALPNDLRDLALHIVVAHHGYSRPVIGTSGCEDAPPSLLQMRAREIALRFARLQRQWGPWGLAWWESLLRAADQQASREDKNRPSSETEARHG